MQPIFHSSKEDVDRILPPISTLDNCIANRPYWPPYSTPMPPTPPALPAFQPDQWSSTVKPQSIPLPPPSQQQQQQQQQRHHKPPSDSLFILPRTPSLDNGHSPASSTSTLFSPPATSSPSYSTPSPSIQRTIENDIDEIIHECHGLSENMTHQKRALTQRYHETFHHQDLMSRPWLDDMVGKANKVLNALLRLRKYQLAVEAAQRRQDHTEARSSGDMRHKPQRQHTKRTFQGRCHSCHISETPEWRRGPNGARTLCNACGLHYAKMERKKALAKKKKYKQPAHDSPDNSAQEDSEHDWPSVTERDKTETSPAG
ncbi:uncharacterized protein BYT42DRAFT_194430 [Radiomyces spectabilis]|uniref:uncharacterized protein n=1 Tax=Radiomyces spectabilis TaxID=64574 RepID=UPI00221E6951|nr:uncharacterized protein BYT42DRAFT_194430 [Radiomyces spectabilis]KAI8391442.1 hypothetical protein BYT42DRAFT_194430 [Radiomyces spectabilis]